MLTREEWEHLRVGDYIVTNGEAATDAGFIWKIIMPTYSRIYNTYTLERHTVSLYSKPQIYLTGHPLNQESEIAYGLCFDRWYELEIPPLIYKSNRLELIDV